MGLPDERWARSHRVHQAPHRHHPDYLDQYCRTRASPTSSGHDAMYFVEAIPKSPVGKLCADAGGGLVRGGKSAPPQSGRTTPMTFTDPASPSSTASRRDRCRARARRHHPRRRRSTSSRCTQRDQLRLVFGPSTKTTRSASSCCARRGALLHSVGNIAGFLGRPRDGLQARLEHRRARASPSRVAANRLFLGVGFEISLACDFRIATESTQYALPEQRLGPIPGSAAPRGFRRSSASPAPRTS